MTARPRIGVLLLYPGAPRTYGEIEEFADVNGLDSSASAVAEMTTRYQLIGGPSISHDTAWFQKVSLQRELDRNFKGTFKVFVGSVNWHPFIAEVVEQMMKMGIDRVIVAPLSWILEEPDELMWRNSIEEAVESAGYSMDVSVAGTWAQGPRFSRLVAARLKLQGPEAKVFFTAPQPGPRAVSSLERLESAAGEIADLAGIVDWEVAWESAGTESGPGSILERIRAYDGSARVLVVPIGSTGDSLSTLFGIDIECADWVSKRDAQLVRMESLNHDPDLIRLLADALEEIARDTGGLSEGTP